METFNGDIWETNLDNGDWRYIGETNLDNGDWRYIIYNGDWRNNINHILIMETGEII